MMDDCPVVILAGGMGTRLREETEYKPKPMVLIGERPILWHIMKIYSVYGFKSFIICLGYRGDIIRGYLLNYHVMTRDFRINLKTQDIEFLSSGNAECDWSVTLVDTGLNAMTGARIKRVESYIQTATFMATYGDGVSDIDIRALIAFHKSHGRIATVTGVHPIGRFGDLRVREDLVIGFSEKPQGSGWVNGGFFIFNREVFNYLSADDDCTLECEPLESLARDGQLAVYKHEGYWHCMDTYRDMKALNEEWATGKAGWKVW